MKKADVFRAAAAYAFDEAERTDWSGTSWEDVAEKILQRHHDKVRRMVVRVRDTPNPHSAANANEYAAWHQEVCDKILARLDAMAGKGNP